MLWLLITAALAGPPQVAGLEASSASVGALAPLEQALLTLAGLGPPRAHDAVWSVVGAPPPQPSLSWTPTQKARVADGKWSVAAGSPSSGQLTRAALADLERFFIDAGDGELYGSCTRLTDAEAVRRLTRLAETYTEQGHRERAIETLQALARRLPAGSDEALDARLRLLVLIDPGSPEGTALIADLRALPSAQHPRAATAIDTALTRHAARAHIDALRDADAREAARQAYRTAFALSPQLTHTALGQTAAALDPALVEAP